MNQLANISKFETISSNTSHAFVFNGYLERLFPKPTMEYTGADSSKPFLGAEGERMALPYEYRLNPDGKINREAAATEYNRARGPGRTIRSILEGMRSVVDRYISYISPETAFVQQAIAAQTADLVQYISFLKEPVVRKRLGIDKGSFRDIERLTIAYVEDAQNKIRKQIIDPLTKVTTAVADASAGGKRGALTWMPDWVTDFIDDQSYKRTLKEHPKELKDRLLQEHKDRRKQLRAEADSLLLGNPENTFSFYDKGLIRDKTGVNKHDNSPYQYRAVEFPPLDTASEDLKRMFTFLGDISGKSRDFGRFVRANDGKETGFWGALRTNGGDKLVNDLANYLGNPDIQQKLKSKEGQLPGAIYKFLEALKKSKEGTYKKRDRMKGQDKDKNKRKD